MPSPRNAGRSEENTPANPTTILAFWAHEARGRTRLGAACSMCTHGNGKNDVQALSKRIESTVQAVSKRRHCVSKLCYERVLTPCVYEEKCVSSLRPSTPFYNIKRGKMVGNRAFWPARLFLEFYGRPGGCRVVWRVSSRILQTLLPVHVPPAIPKKP